VFFFWSETTALNFIIVTYSLHQAGKTILHWK